MSDFEAVLLGYTNELNALDIPTFFSPKTQDIKPRISPLVTRLKLKKITVEIDRIRELLSSQNTKVSDESIIQVQNLLDEKIYMNNEQYETWKQNQIRSNQEEDLNDSNTNSTTQGGKSIHDAVSLGSNRLLGDSSKETGEENLNELRHRLLSLKSSSLLDKTNEYHESVQEDILSELTGFAATLKESALKLSSKIAEDTKIMEATGENLAKNLGLMGIVDRNLNLYVMNKTGGKISIWFLAKIGLLLFFLFFFMVVLIKIFPKM